MNTRSWEEEGTPLFDGEKWYYFHLRNFSQNSLVCANNYGFNIETDEYFIGYSDVIERTGTGGYTHYHYSSWDDTPDKTDVTKNIIYKNNTSITDYLLCEKNSDVHFSTTCPDFGENCCQRRCILHRIIKLRKQFTNTILKTLARNTTFR